MKKLFSCFLVVLILCLCVVPAFAASPKLSVSASSYMISKDDVITVSVNLSAGSNLSILNFVVNYDASQFEYVDGSKSTTSVFDMAEANVKAGGVSYAGIDNGSVTEGGTLLTFKLKSLKGGGRLSISVIEATLADYTDVTSTIVKSSANISCSHENLVWKVTKKATCTETGIETGTCPCGNHTETREIKKTGHKFSNPTVVKEATCTETGLERGVCLNCKENKDNVIPAKGHSFGGWITRTEPSMFSTGISERVCKNCAYVEQKILPATGVVQEPSTAPVEPTTEPVVTEPTTHYEPVTPTEPEPPTYQEYETEPETEPSGGMFSGLSDMSESDKASIIVIVLAVLIVIVLAVYILLIIQRRKK